MFVMVTVLAIWAATIGYYRPKHAAMVFAMPIAAFLLMCGAMLAPEKQGKWLRPVAVIVIGGAAFAFGVWMNSSR
jgi:O-antigen ligase